MATTMIGLACARASVAYDQFPDPRSDLTPSFTETEAHAVVAGGCFWCTEGVFENIPGVTDVVSVYAGGSAATANYDAVCSGTTGHAEAIRITYDPRIVTYGKLLKVFFSIAHDPTTLNRQGNDAGTQYRSAIFYASEDEKSVADAYIKQLNEAKIFPSPVVTTLEPLTEYFVAEKYHQDYARQNADQPYIRGAALPKMEKAKKVAKEMQPEATTKPAG